eukprot:TRINITY_DN20282_c0_g1_i1.p1 TRINITY_DN20282_c0_g1~~TRINITY_DN20282_c0_g1_i1.p1  ORF type:complete len:383 (+),score=136.75 TRINITY_DN20282_c0_g1_i1:82-1230(+)
MDLSAYGPVVAAAIARGEIAAADEDVRQAWAPKGADAKTIRAIDFYSGIGGNHFALEVACERLGLKEHVVCNIEINDLANRTYTANFPETKLRQTSIQGVKRPELEKAKADLWLASPPCQPFTRMGLQLGKADARTDSFYHLLDCLEKMHHSKRPGMLFIENVKNFEDSLPHYDLLTTLHALGYSTREYLLNPNQQGIPNSRLRYYLIAKMRGGGAPTHAPLCTAPPRGAVASPPTLAAFLPGNAAPQPEHLLTSETLDKPLVRLMDVVFPGSTGSMCFTKGYPRFVEGTGSMLCHGAPDKAAVKAAIAGRDAQPEPCPAGASALLPLQIRYFAPREIADLMCFPARFRFHPDATLTQQYRLLGNSVCVAVVTDVLEELLKW